MWFATPGAPGQLLIRQEKRRGSPKVSLVVEYHEDDESGAITLESAGPVEDTETAQERAQDWIKEFLVERGASRTSAIEEAGQAAAHTEPTITRGLSRLKKLDVLHHPQRGWYEIVS